MSTTCSGEESPQLRRSHRLRNEAKTNHEPAKSDTTTVSEEKSLESATNVATCKNCKKDFKTLGNHLAKKPECKIQYPEHELKAWSKQKKKQAKDNYNTEYYRSNKEKLVHKQKMRDQKTRKEKAEKQKVYDQKRRKEKAEKQKVYDQTRRKEKAEKQKVYDEKRRKEKAEKQKVYDQKRRKEKAEKQRVYDQNRRIEKAEKQKVYDQKRRGEKVAKHRLYNLKNRQLIMQKQRGYNKKHREMIRQKHKKYNIKNKEIILQKQRKYQEIKDMTWSEGATKGLLQDGPIFKKAPYRRVIKWIDQEQLVDCLSHFKNFGDPEYQDVKIDYSFMQESMESDPQPTIGLNNTLVFPGRKTELPNSPIITFDGEVLRDTINVVLKLRTRSSQPEVEKEGSIQDWVDEDQLIEVVKFWKRKDHASLRGIRFPDIVDDWESSCEWSERQLASNKEKVIKSWKYLSTKPRDLLKKYHNSQSSSSSDDDDDWMEAAGEELLQDVPQYKEFRRETRRVVKWIDPELLVDYLNYYKEDGLHEYQDYTIDYWKMPTEEFNPEDQSDYNDTVTLGSFKTQPNPQKCEIGLCNTVISPGEHNIWTFDGEEVKEDLNVILKLKTMSNQPEVDTRAEWFWWVDPDHLIKAVRYWKKRNHPSLTAISFPDISHTSWDITWGKELRKKKEERVMKNWKHLPTKPYNLLVKYHQNFLEENGITCEEDLLEKFPVQRGEWDIVYELQQL